MGWLQGLGVVIVLLFATLMLTMGPPRPRVSRLTFARKSCSRAARESSGLRASLRPAPLTGRHGAYGPGTLRPGSPRLLRWRRGGTAPSSASGSRSARLRAHPPTVTSRQGDQPGARAVEA